MFAECAPMLWEQGFPAIPLNLETKIPAVNGWGAYCVGMPDLATQEQWLRQFPNYGLGLVLGPQSGLMMLDCDIVDDEIAERVLAGLKDAVGHCPLWVRRGAKGFAVALHWRPEAGRKLRWLGDCGAVELLTGREASEKDAGGSGQQLAIPPTIHPKTGEPYQIDGWVNLDDPSGVELLLQAPDLGPDWLLLLDRVCGAVGCGRPGLVPAGQRHDHMAKIAGTLPWDVIRGQLSWLDACAELDRVIRQDLAVVDDPIADYAKWLGEMTGWFIKAATKGKDGQNPRLPAKGWDEGLTEDEIVRLGFDEIQTRASALDRAIESYVFQAGTKRFIHRRALTEVDGEGLAALFVDDVGHLDDRFAQKCLARGMTVVQGRRFHPGKPPIFTDEHKLSWFNSWVRPSVWDQLVDFHVTDDMIQPYLDHMRYLIPEEINLTYFHDLISHTLCHPEKKPKRGFVLGSREKQFGKDFIVEQVLVPLFGSDNTVKVNNDSLKERFNSYRSDSSLMVIEELMAYGRQDVANELKVTVADNDVSVRRMYQDQTTEKSYCLVIAMTNYSAALYLDDDDQRWAVSFTDGQRIADECYYEDLRDWCRENLALIYSWYLQRKRTLFTRAGSKPPMSNAKRRMINGSGSDWQLELIEWHRDKVWPLDRDVVSVKQVAACLKKAGHRDVSDRKLKRFLLEKFGDPDQLRRQITYRMPMMTPGFFSFDGERQDVVYVRQPERWGRARDAAVRAELEKAVEPHVAANAA